MKFAVAKIDCCARCPNAVSGGRWCSETERETEGAFKAPPPWCPLPDSDPVQAAVQAAVEAERARVLGIVRRQFDSPSSLLLRCAAENQILGSGGAA